MDTIEMVADEFGFEVERLDIYSSDSGDESIMEDEGNLKERPPVVTIMGHVDHGKTSLLDYIRDTNIIAGEAGGITQHIGAYEVKVKNGKKITFIDTPGHAAFTAMRARGAQVTDIVVLIVAADDGLKPQTLEAIDHAQAANVPLIVAINKIDLPAANADNVKKQLSEKNILVEEWGGKYQSADISAKKGTGIDELLDKILIEAEVLDLKANYDCSAKAVIVESRLDKGLGPIATILVQHGIVKKGDIFLCGAQYSKIRELLNERNDIVEYASPSDPVQVLGFKTVPNAGDLFQIYTDEREAKKISLQRSQLEREATFHRHSKITLDQVGKNIKTGSVKDLNIIIKGDVDGSIEALSDSLMDLSNDEVNIKIVLKSAGMISQNDISLASASNAIVVAFNVSASVNARKLAKSYGIEIRYYSVIYEAIDEIKLALEGLLDPDIVEDSIGKAIVKESFKIPKVGIISGSYVEEGKVIKNSLLRVLREGEIIYEGNLTSLKRFKEDVNEVKNGFECGIGVAGFYDFEENDVIEVYAKKEVKRTLK
jgi:translation initiation factor IF-2